MNHRAPSTTYNAAAKRTTLTTSILTKSRTRNVVRSNQMVAGEEAGGKKPSTPHLVAPATLDTVPVGTSGQMYSGRRSRDAIHRAARSRVPVVSGIDSSSLGADPLLDVDWTREGRPHDGHDQRPGSLR